MNAKAIHDPRYHTLVGIISDTRKRKGLTQFELGRRLLLSRQTIQKIESCEVRLDILRYVTLCRILGLNAGRLLGRLEEPSEEDDPLYLSATPCLFDMALFLRKSIQVELRIFYWPLLRRCGFRRCGFQPTQYCLSAGYFTGHFLATF